MGLSEATYHGPHGEADRAEVDRAELAHQVQNRLSVARASVQLALARCSCAAAHAYLQRTLAALDDAAAWVALLVEGHSAELLQPQEPVRLDLLVAEAARDLADLVERSGVRLELQLDDGERLWTHGSPRLLKGAVANLLVNAVEATPEDGAIRVRTWAQEAAGQDDGWACLCVEDSGPGLAPDVLAKLFRSPISTKAPAGRGIGLLLAHRTISRLHGGWISAANLPAGGARICIGLPLRPPSHEQPNGSPAAPTGCRRIPGEGRAGELADETSVGTRGYPVSTAAD